MHIPNVVILTNHALRGYLFEVTHLVVRCFPRQIVLDELALALWVSIDRKLNAPELRGKAASRWVLKMLGSIPGGIVKPKAAIRKRRLLSVF